MTDLTAVWDAHVAAEFEHKDVWAAVETMCADAFLIHVPVATGARGRDELQQFYADIFIPSWPDDTEVASGSRTVGVDRVVDELLVSGTHDRPMPFSLPGVAPTGRRFSLLHVAVIEFRDGLIVSEHIYWDQASLLVQLGLLADAESLPVLGVAQTRAYTDSSYPLNELIGERRAPEERSMPEAYIVEAARTPVGKRGGGLAQVHPADLGAHVITAVVERSGIDPDAVEDVFFGCVDQLGPQAGDIARTSWLAAGYTEDVPGTTIDRQCGSSQQALHFAAQAVMSGTNDVIVAGGVQNMSMIPIAAALTAAEPFGFADPFSGSEGWMARYGDQEISQFRGAELIAEKWGISREEMEGFALESHERAIRAQDEGRFDVQIVPLRGVEHDEGPRRGTSLEKMAQLPPLEEGGRLTAAVSSQISDGASGMLVVSEQALRDHGLTPRARVHHLSVRGDSPVLMLSAPIPATAYALEKTGMTLDEIDLVEINEAFASVVLAWQKETGADLAKVNVNGGAIALGHPLGATGTRLMTTLLHELERTGGRYGLQTMCEGGGQANVTIIERLG